MVLNKEEKNELRNIMLNEYARGAFAGMVTNLSLQLKADPELVIEHAMKVKLIMKELSEEKLKTIEDL